MARILPPDELNLRRLKQIYSDMDEQVYVRAFSGRITKGRWKFLHRFARKNSWRINCGCPGDCCGCLFRQSVEVSYRHNQVVVLVKYYFNY